MIRWYTSGVFLLFTIGILGSCSNQQAPATAATAVVEDTVVTAPMTIFLVRHAEKETGEDPGLTEEGLDRAERLANLLSAVEFDAIFSTDYRRTQLTAAPTAAAKEITVQSYNPRELPAFAEKLKADFAGKTILVVGHSNTTPTLTGLIDGTESHAPFDESDYENLMMVTIPAKGPAKTVRLRF